MGNYFAKAKRCSRDGCNAPAIGGGAFCRWHEPGRERKVGGRKKAVVGGSCEFWVGGKCALEWMKGVFEVDWILAALHVDPETGEVMSESEFMKWVAGRARTSERVLLSLIDRAKGKPQDVIEQRMVFQMPPMYELCPHCGYDFVRKEAPKAITVTAVDVTGFVLPPVPEDDGDGGE